MAADTYKTTINGYMLEPSLPDEVLAVLPTDTYLQLDLAYKITCHAYSQQVSRLEREGQEMQSTISQNQQVIKSLERRVAGMEADMQEHQQRCRQSMAEQHKLAAEKNALIETVKRLNREVAKLEHFKRNLLQQLQDEDESDGAGALAPSMAAVDMTTERLVSEVLQSADSIAAAAAAAANQQQQAQGSQAQFDQQLQRYTQAQHSNRSSPPRGSHPGTFGTAGLGPNRKHGSPNSPNNNMARVTQPPAWQQQQQNSHFPIKASGVPNSAPTSPYRQRPSPPSPPNRSGAGAPGALNAAAGAAANMGQLGASGRFAASAGGALTPTKAAAGGLGAAAAGRAAAGGGGSGGGAAAGVSMTSPRIDGKEFFRQARARLSYEQFSQFLVAIKDLNAGRVSREDTLAAAQQLFGPANNDLYGLFEGLLLRHLTSL